MKTFLKVLAALTLLASSARAGMYYDLQQTASSATMKLGGVMRVSDGAAPTVPTITLNGTGGAVTATTFTGSASGLTGIPGAQITGAIPGSSVNLSTVTTALDSVGASTASIYSALQSTAGTLTAEIARAVAVEKLKLTSGAVPTDFVNLSTVTTAVNAVDTKLAPLLTKLSTSTLGIYSLGGAYFGNYLGLNVENPTQMLHVAGNQIIGGNSSISGYQDVAGSETVKGGGGLGVTYGITAGSVVVNGMNLVDTLNLKLTSGAIPAAFVDLSTVTALYGPYLPALSTGTFGLVAPGSAFSVGNSTLVVANGRVGILQPSPAYALDVNGYARVAQSAYVAGSLGVGTVSPDDLIDVENGNIRFTATGGASTRYIQFVPATTGSTLSMNFGSANNMEFIEGGGATRMYIKTGGNVGIGTAAPGSKLHVAAGVVNVSSSTTSGLSQCIAGAFDTLPTTGYAEGCWAYQWSDHKAYISTETVSIAESWKALW